METNVSIVFKNLIFSSLENTTAIMELTYENKNVKFSYPLKEPIKITFSPKFISDKVNLTLSVIENINKKTKLAFRSDLVVNKSLFMDGKQIYEKILTLIPLDYKDIKKSGKIYMEMKLLDNLDDGKKNLKSNSKKKNSQKINQNPNKLDDKNEFDDNLSLINVSNIEDEGLQNKKTYFGELIDIDYINKLKNILENDYQRILPTDINSLKNYNQNLYKKYREIGNRYNETIKELNSNNENIRNKAINYFNYYKELKNQLTQRRLELKNKKNKLESEKNINNEDKSLIAGNIENFTNEKEIFLNKLSNPEGGSNDANNLAIISSGTNNSDIKMLSEAIKKISSLGYDIIDGMKISEEERKLLSVIIGTNLCDNIKNEELDEDKRHEGTGNGQEEYDENNMKDDFEFGNKIVALIERDVNELYSRKLIHQVKIDQIDAITYSFSDDDKEKNVSFKIENNNLFCIDSGESFTVWLLSNFST